MQVTKIDLEKIQKAKAAVEKNLVDLKKANADAIYPNDAENINMSDVIYKFQSMISSLSYAVSNLSDQINYLSDNFYKHSTDGHLPPAPGPAAMASAIKALGWDGDFEVQPRSIYASLKDGFIKIDGQKIN